MANLSTKIAISNSLENLLKHKHFSAITVKDIVQDCGLTRTTFYRHFIDINDLVSWIYRYNVDKIIKEYDINHWTANVEAISLFIYSKKDFLRAVCEYYGQNSFMSFLYDYSIEYLVGMLNKEGVAIDEELSNAIRFYVNGAVYTDYLWIINNFKETPSQITKIICDNVPHSLQKYFCLN